MNNFLCRRKELNSEASQSIFPWPILPQRTYFKNSRKKIPDLNPVNTEYYPNCDANVWLRTCKHEVVKPIEGKFFGNIPLWLNGSLYRNGPGSLQVGEYEFNHVFDSSALVHRFLIQNRKVYYQCRFIQTETYKRNWNAKRIVISEFGTKAISDPCHSIFRRISTIFNPNDTMTDNTMISIYPFNDELFAFCESPVIYKINRNTLSTDERIDLHRKIGIMNHTSHPHIISDGSVYNLGMSFKNGLKHNILHFPGKGTRNSSDMFNEAKIIASIPVRWPLNPSYMHTFGITPNFFIIVEQPLSVSVLGLAKCKIKNDPLIGAFNWFNNEFTQITVINRTTGCAVRKFYTDTFFYLHIINQYEKDGDIILDICTYRDPSMIECMYVDSLKTMQNNPDYATMFKSIPLRFVLPMNITMAKKTIGDKITFNGFQATAHVIGNDQVLLKPEFLCNIGCETPRVNYESYCGREYRYFYAISSDVDRNNSGTIIKVDTQNKKYITWCEENCYPSEPIFVPKPRSRSEDDGVILSSMVWGKNDTNRVGLLVLNAKTLTEMGRVEFKTLGPVPKCLHGWFLHNSNI